MIRRNHIGSRPEAIHRRPSEGNHIPLVMSECAYDSECRGTCPCSESEVRYLETELLRRARVANVAIVADIAVTLTRALSGIIHYGFKAVCPSKTPLRTWRQLCSSGKRTVIKERLFVHNSTYPSHSTYPKIIRIIDE